MGACRGNGNPEKDENQELRVSVRDTGIGIPKAAQGGAVSKIQSGRRIDDPPLWGVPASAWPFAAKLIDLMGGKIGIDSTPGARLDVLVHDARQGDRRNGTFRRRPKRSPGGASSSSMISR